jgi:hypothetical protein
MLVSVRISMNKDECIFISLKTLNIIILYVLRLAMQSDRLNKT